MNSLKYIAGVVLVAILAIGATFYFTHQQSPAAGSNAAGPQHYQTEPFFAGLQIGVRTSIVSSLIFGKYSLIGVNANIAASSTVSFDAAVPGMLPGDTVFANFATSTNTGAGWEIVGVSASSTAGFATIRVTNGTGVSAYPPASIASSTPILDLR